MHTMYTCSMWTDNAKGMDVQYVKGDLKMANTRIGSFCVIPIFDPELVR